MRMIVILFAVLASGCASMERADQKTALAEPQHPQVMIQGVDGTAIKGELLNGSVTIDSGQGQLTLLTDHLHSITMSQDLDKLDSDSIKVAGKVTDTHFLVRNEHGVFTLSKDRLREIDFVNNPSQQQATTTAMTGGATGISTVRAAGATSR